MADTSYASVLPLPYGDLHVHRDGPRDAPALLLIHGSATSSRSWDSLVPLLAESRHVIRVDLPGHGRSAEPAGGRGYEAAEQADTIGAALDLLHVRHVTVVGHSSGGYTATALAELRPDLVTALALINSGPGMDAFIAPEALPIDPAHWPPGDEQLRQFASAGFRPGFHIPQELVDELRGMSIHVIASAMQACTGYLKQQALPARLTAVGKPLLVVFGELDRRWQASSSAAQYRQVPGAEVVLMPDAGHTPILEEPVRTAALLLPFAERHAT
ncbi:alpha/beta fold hydrolase [Streptomyces sp. NPDC050658]|uniref:alpha/beta fold hydrolase n=1 Tax=unclassified Streptomyces TaxID=2593676 RepID=UPI003441CFCC